MKNKYRLTKNLSNIITEIREASLGYTHEEFAEILTIEPSTSYYMCKNIRMKTIPLERLIAIFAVDYNLHLFILKYKQMENILEQAIKDGKFEKTTSLRTIFGSKAAIIEKNNPTLCKPPIEIFTEQKCSINREKFIANRYDENLFDESLFPEKLRYVKIPTDSSIDDIYKLSNGEIKSEVEKNEILKSKKEFERIQEHIVKRIDNILDTESTNYLSQEYWLFALYFLYKEVTVIENFYEFIKKCFLKTGDTGIAWLDVFKMLSRNKNLNKNEYSHDDCLYFRDIKGNDISHDNLPVFYYKYRTSYIEGNSSDIKKYFRNYYDEELGNACQLKFKLVHLFLIVNQHYLNTGKTEDEAFKATCLKLYLEGVTLPFNKFNLIDLPKKKEYGLTSQTHEFYLYIKNFFDKKDIDKNELSLLEFKKNFLSLNLRFFDVIAVDFEFLKRLGSYYDNELNEALENTTKQFKEDNLLD